MGTNNKISFLRDLLNNEISDELREDFCDYLLAVQADKEGGATSFDEYHKMRMAKIRAKSKKR